MREVEPTPLADVPPVEPEPSTTVATPAAAVEEWSATAVTSLRPPALPADRPRPQPAPSEVVESAWAPTPAPARRPMRIDGDGDDDPRPVQDAPIRPQPPQPRVQAEPSTGPGEYPIPPAYADAAPPRPSVPTWSYRGAPGPVPDVGIDPTTLRRRVKLRSGTSGIVVDETRLVVRRWWRRREIDWRDVEGFEPRFAGGDPSGGGRLVARTVHGPVELPVTGDTAGDLRYLHALLDAYRLRSRSLDDRS